MTLVESEKKRTYQREYARRRYQNDPVYREKVKQRASSPEARKRANERKAERIKNDPEYHQRLLEQHRNYYHRTLKFDTELKERKYQYLKERAARPEVKLRSIENGRRYREKFRIRCLVRGAILRARKAGMEVDTVFLRNLALNSRPEKCQCCLTALDYSYRVKGAGAGGPLPNGPSLDRVDPTKGYIAGNVEIICWRCNALKRDATLAELERIVAYMKVRL